jgi:acetylornithine deacetylase/succinyl-diaminopimelate desuccinylase-like protein
MAAQLRSSLLFAALAWLPTFLSAQTPAQAALDFTNQHKAALVEQYTQFLAMPNVAADPAGLQRNADFLIAQLRQRGVEAQLLSLPGAPSVVYGKVDTPGAQRTIAFYAHYDGQPVTPADWTVTPPFTPILRDPTEGPATGNRDGNRDNDDRRIYARSAGDDKAAIFAQLTALDALRAAHLPIKANIRFIWDGEEEAGSPHLEAILNAHKDLVRSDVMLVCDGPVDQSGRQTVVFGARGDAHLEITLFGPHHGLHSGHYGNWAPNPAMMLAQLLAGMKSEDGHVLIPHFYDGITPLTAIEKQALANAPVNDRMLMDTFWLGHTEGGGAHLLELINQPSLNINGLSSAQTGAHAANVIPPTATADIDLRLVVGIDWQQQQQRIVDYIQSRGYFIVESEPTREILLAHPKVARVLRDPASYNAIRTPMDLPIAQKVIAAVRSARGEVVLLPTMGGSVPLEAMERPSGARTITVPIANYDDNQHAANENLRLQNLWNGVGTMAALLTIE